MSESIEDRYARLLAEPSDIRAHLPRLRALAAGCGGVVVELGVRTARSTTALLAGALDRAGGYVLACDAAECPEARGLAALAPGALSVVVCDSRELVAPPHDLLFIDTLHTAAQLAAELARHAPLCRGRVALHDTETFGEVGEDGGPGLMAAVREFLAANPAWAVESHDPADHGLTVLARGPADGQRGRAD